ncbi:pyrroline-5-carboxylate reductase [Marisediminicola sp. LYQ85]|uniref:pyrroline-5-carboxylate reductase n=1 Tax=Marisediminicola sp. LYQ85 TaxID=3391062 RepID=UPI003983506B
MTSPSTTLPTTAILGAGSMGGAILAGMLAPSVTVSGGIRVTNRTEAKAAAVRAPGVESLATETVADANIRAVRGARIVIVGVKPHMVAELLSEIAPHLEPDAVVVSVAAGVAIETMEAIVTGSVLRAMPNTPSTIGLGVTGLSGGTRSSDDDIAVVTRLFETVGSVVPVPETQIDALSTISGSGPAYVFFLVEQLTRAAVGLGFTREQADTMVVGTFRGASELLARSGEPADELRRRVTSPNGTTERAIAVLETADLADVFDRATAAALARAVELSKG